jgi:hypothetical protein
MATIGNNADTLLQGLSDFWLRYFRDLGDLQATYEGTTILFGQNYLDLMSSVLNQSVVDVPLFNKDYYRLITIREDQLVYKQTLNSNTTGWALSTDQYGSVPSLQNKVYNPTAALEANLDYLVNDGELIFLNDPTDPPAQGYAQRPVQVMCGGFFSATNVSNWRSLGIQKGDTLEATAAGQTARLFKISHVDTKRLALSNSTPAPVVPSGATAQTYSWRILRNRVDDNSSVSGLPVNPTATGTFAQPGPLQVYEVSFWAVDAQVDDGELYRTFGHLFGAPQKSTESYRAFIRGLMQLYALGPAVDRIESALNVAAGLAVIRDDGEVFKAYENGLDAFGSDGELLSNTFYSASANFSSTYVGGYLKVSGSLPGNDGIVRIVAVVNAHELLTTHWSVGFTEEEHVVWEFSRTDQQRVITSSHEYVYSRYLPMRSDLLDPLNAGILTFRAFEPLTAAVQVVDYIKEPEWWHGIVIPEELMPGRNEAARTATPQLFPLKIGPVGNWKIGDVGVKIGATEDGVVRSNIYRHCAAFLLADRYLKYHMFAVRISNSLGTNLVSRLRELLREMKPAYTTVYFQLSA